MSGRFPHDGFTDLVGRQDELARIAAMLAESRLVTIVGPGGVGKTRVALVAAAQAAGRYRDGPWIVELSGLRDPALLPNTVASVLGLPEQDARSALDALLEYLRDRRLLLILDTCEHLLDACAALAQAVLRDAPGVTVLATSRQPLDMPGEHTFPVGPLPVPRRLARRWPTAAWRAAGTRSSCSRCAPPPRCPASRSPRPTWPTSSGCAGGSTGYRWRSSWRRSSCARCRSTSSLDRLDHRFAVLTGGQAGGAAPAPDAAHGDRVVVRAVLGRRAAAVGAAVGVRRDGSAWSRPRKCAPRWRSSGPTWSTRSSGSSTSPSCCGRASVPDARHAARVRRRAARGIGRAGVLPGAAHRAVPGHGRYFGDHFADDDQMDRYHELREVHPNLRAALEYALEDEDPAAAAGSPAAEEPFGLASGPGGSSGSVATTVAVERWRAGGELACSLYGYWQISGLLGEGAYWLTKVLDRFPDAGPERARALVNRGFLRSFQGNIDERARRLRGRHRDGARDRRRRHRGPRVPAHDAHAHLPRAARRGGEGRRRGAGPAAGVRRPWRAS